MHLSWRLQRGKNDRRFRGTVQMTRRIYIAGIIRGGGSKRYFLSLTYLFFSHRSWPIRDEKCTNWRARRSDHREYFCISWKRFSPNDIVHIRARSASSSYAHAFELLFVIRVSFRRNISAVICVLERLAFAIPCRDICASELPSVSITTNHGFMLTIQNASRLFFMFIPVYKK